MSDLKEIQVLIDAGLNSVDAESVINLSSAPSGVRDAIDADWPIGDHERDRSEARNAWWASDIIPFAFKRLLDAKQAGGAKAIHVSSAKAHDVPPGYVYDPRLSRYRNLSTGKFVSFRRIYELLDSNEAATVDTLQNLSESLFNGEISEAQWYAAMQMELRRLHVQNAALGAGGLDALKPADYRRIDESLRSDMDRLEVFGHQIVAGEQTLAQIQNRVNMYAGTARVHFYRTQRPPLHGRNEVVLERRVLRPADHCSYCVYQAELGWQPWGTLPKPGESSPEWEDDQCLSNCRCEMQIAIVPRDSADGLIAGTLPPEMATPLKGGSPRVMKVHQKPDGFLLWAKSWDPEKHPREPAGTEAGGQFTSAGTDASGQFASAGTMEGRDDGLVGGKVPANERVWQGQSYPSPEKRPSKIEYGRVGEALATKVLGALFGDKFSLVNVGINNAPIDVAGDHLAVEVKTGMAYVGKKSQRWRASIGEPGKAEKAALRAMTAAQKREHNLWKKSEIMKRKRRMVDMMSEEAGAEIRPATVGIIMTPDMKRADVFMLDGFHLSANWSQFATNDNYVGTFNL